MAGCRLPAGRTWHNTRCGLATGEALAPLAGASRENTVIAASRIGRRKASRPIRLGLLGAAVLLILAVTIALFADSRPAAAARHGSAGDGWVTSWSASPQVATPDTLAAAGFDNQTIRDIIFTSVGGDPIRLELTNVFGASPLRVGHVTVAVAGPGAAVLPGTIHPVTYRGSASFQIPAGAQILSDPVAMRVSPLQDLAVSVYLPGQTAAATFHADAQQVNWVSARRRPRRRLRCGRVHHPDPVLVLRQRPHRAIARRGRDRRGVRRLDHRWRGVDHRRRRPLAQRPGPQAGRAGQPDAVGGRRGYRRQPGADRRAVLRCQRRGAVRAGRPGPARSPGRHRAGGDQRHRVQRGGPGRRRQRGPDHRRVPAADRRRHTPGACGYSARPCCRSKERGPTPRRARPRARR